MFQKEIASGNYFRNKRVIVRVDFNIPMENGVILDSSKIDGIYQTIDFLIKSNAKIVLISHLGSPDRISKKYSLKSVFDFFAKNYHCRAAFVKNNIITEIAAIIEISNQNDIILLENIRFYKEELDGDLNFAKHLSKLGDFYINEAFSASHRYHSSIVGIPKFLPHAFGFAFRKEKEMIDKFMLSPAKSIMCILGGSKLSTKIRILKNIVTKVDKLAVGGGIAGAFLNYFGTDSIKISGAHKFEEEIKEIVKNAHESSCQLIIPSDFSALIDYKNIIKDPVMLDTRSNATIYDIGPESIKLIQKHINKSSMVLWNGPLGFFEKSPFDTGTISIANEIAKCTTNKGLISIVGGGDTTYAINKFGLHRNMSYVSTSGGAFLKYVENRTLPGIEIMKCEKLLEYM